MKRYELCERYIGCGDYVADTKEAADGDRVLYATALDRLRAALEMAYTRKTSNDPVQPTVADVLARLKEEQT